MAFSDPAKIVKKVKGMSREKSICRGKISGFNSISHFTNFITSNSIIKIHSLNIGNIWKKKVQLD